MLHKKANIFQDINKNCFMIKMKEGLNWVKAIFVKSLSFKTKTLTKMESKKNNVLI